MDFIRILALLPFQNFQMAALIWNDGTFPDMKGSSVESQSSLVIRLSAETLR